MLYREMPDGSFKPWFGEELDGVWHSRNIESLWTEEELAAVGLFKAIVPEPPPGKHSVADRVERVDGVVQHVCDWEDD